MKKILNKITAITLTVCLSFTCIMGVSVLSQKTCLGGGIAYAATTGKYVSDLAVSYAASKEAAQEELGENYTILDKDFNDGLSGHTWIGYMTTDDESEAITDIKAMNMDGNYSYSDYEELLKEMEEAVKAQVDTVVPALINYADNYDASLETTKSVYESLNIFYEDDSEQNMGDYLLSVGRALSVDASDSAALEKVEKVFLQGNDYLINSIENLLIQAADTEITEEGSWITRLSDMGPDGLTNIYKQSYPKLSGKKLKAQMSKDLGDDAAELLTEIASYRDTITAYEESDIAQAVDSGDDEAFENLVDTAVSEEGGDEAIDASATADEIAENMTESAEALTYATETANNFITAAVVAELKNTSYGDQTMYAFFMDESLTAEDLYPVAYVMNQAQKNLISDTGVSSVFTSSIAEYAEAGASDGADISVDLDEGGISIYEGVDRSMFDGDSAITADALKRMASSGESNIPGSDLDWAILAASTMGFLACAMAFIGGADKRVIVTEGHFDKNLYNDAVDNLEKKLSQEYEVIYKNEYAYIIRQAEVKGWINGTTDLTKLTANDIKSKARSYMKQLEPSKVNHLRSKIKWERAKVQSGQIAESRGAYVAEALKNQDKALRDAAYVSGERKVVTRMGARVFMMVFQVAMAAVVVYEIYNILSSGGDDEVEFTDIPARMTDRSYDQDEITYIDYSVVMTADGTKADLHNWDGKQWLALYTTTDTYAGDPILAKTLEISAEGSSANAKLNAVSIFGEGGALNIADKSITGKKTESTYIFYENGTVVSEGADEESEDVASEGAKDNAVADPATGDAQFSSSVANGSGNGPLIWILVVAVAILCLAGGYYAGSRKRRE